VLIQRLHTATFVLDPTPGHVEVLLNYEVINKFFFSECFVVSL